MIADIKALLSRRDTTLVSDALGAAALVVMMIAALHLPSLT
ncbi:hypothetical protein [Actibacterium sp. 188UL27-1]|nr:hypothetical protein [Actibacterium sp. 188UL27-1]